MPAEVSRRWRKVCFRCRRFHKRTSLYIICAEHILICAAQESAFPLVCTRNALWARTRPNNMRLRPRMTVARSGRGVGSCFCRVQWACSSALSCLCAPGRSRITLMSIAGARLPLLLILIAFVAAIIFVIGHARSGDGRGGARAQRAETPSSHSESRVIAPAGGTVLMPSSASIAAQKPGPPDPVAEKTAADSAARAADAAAALAAAAPGPGN